MELPLRSESRLGGCGRRREKFTNSPLLIILRMDRDSGWPHAVGGASSSEAELSSVEEGVGEGVGPRRL